jgi:hypothetical protein
MEETIEQNKAIETEHVVRKKLGGYRTMPFIIGDHFSTYCSNKDLKVVIYN